MASVFIKRLKTKKIIDMTLFQRVTRSDIRNIIAVISVIGAFLMLYLIIVKPIPAENKDTVNLAVGFILGGLVGGVNGFYFGSSKGTPEKEKTED
jgi:hypothetical protein